MDYSLYDILVTQVVLEVKSVTSGFLKDHSAPYDKVALLLPKNKKNQNDTSSDCRLYFPVFNHG